MHVITATQMYEMDRLTMKEIGLPGILLMENSGQAVAREIMDRVNKSDHIVVLAGSGNNGGDGFVITRILWNLGYKISLWVVGEESKIMGDAKQHLTILENSGYEPNILRNSHKELYQALSQSNVIIDAMLGIGLKGDIRSPFKEIIEICNNHRGYKIAVDIPSGLPTNGVNTNHEVFHADLTITLQLPKMSTYLSPFSTYFGELVIADIGIPQRVVEKVRGNIEVWTKDKVKASFPKRNSLSHKGTYGKGLVIGGSKTMTGAPVMAAKAALRAGAGLITTAIPENIHFVAGQLLESMFLPWSEDQGGFSGEIEADLSSFTAILVGPGMGRTPGTSRLLKEVLKADVPILLDADALFHLSNSITLLKERAHPTILTPHSGEMARLLNISVEDLERNRFEIASEFALKHGVYLVLKGPYTLVTSPIGKQTVNTTGNASLAKGGSGDVLSGILLAFMMQHTNIQIALSNGVHVHGLAADYLVHQSHTMIDVLASDIINALPITFRTLQ